MDNKKSRIHIELLRSLLKNKEPSIERDIVTLACLIGEMSQNETTHEIVIEIIERYKNAN